MGKSTTSDQNGLKKGPWTAEEDQKLIDYIQKHGHGRWRTLPKNAGLNRCGKSCRLRWTNYLRPDIRRGKFSIEEEDIIIQLHSVLGNKWSVIAAQLTGRTDNEIKNYWNTHIKKRLLRMGIDPVTHKPRLDLLQLYSLINPSLQGSPQLLNFPSFDGNCSMLNNPNLVNLATTLLSHNNQILVNTKNLQDYPIANNNYDVVDQNLYQSSPSNPLQSGIQSCTTQSSSENLFSQANLEQLCSDSTKFISQNYLQEPLQANNVECPNSTSTIGENFVPNFGICQYSTHYNQPIMENKIETLQNMSFGSLLSTTPSCRTTPLNSSSITYVNGGDEDERESYCSNMLMFNIPTSSLGV